MSGVSRSMDAIGARAAAQVARQRRAQPNGWWGMALVIATEATLISTVLASYYYLRFNTARWPPPGIEKPDLAVGLVLLGVLVSTSVPMWLVVRAARAGRGALVWWLVFGALVVQAGYFAMQIHLFMDDLGKFQPSQNAYGSIYFTMLAIDHGHVAAGILLSLGVLAKLLGGLTNYRLIGVRTLALFWHFVNLLTVCVVLTQLSPSL